MSEEQLKQLDKIRGWVTTWQEEAKLTDKCLNPEEYSVHFLLQLVDKFADAIVDKQWSWSVNEDGYEGCPWCLQAEKSMGPDHLPDCIVLTAKEISNE